MRRLGKRKQWIVLAQVADRHRCWWCMSLLEPRTQLGWFSLLAGIGAFMPARRRISSSMLGGSISRMRKRRLISSPPMYQVGYRLAALVGGALGRSSSPHDIGWPQTYHANGSHSARRSVSPACSRPMPHVERANRRATRRDSSPYAAPVNLHPAVRARGIDRWWARCGPLAIVHRASPSWCMSMTAAPEERPNPTDFTLYLGAVDHCRHRWWYRR